MSKVRVLISDPMSSQALNVFEQRGIEVVQTGKMTNEELVEMIPDFDGLAIQFVGPFRDQKQIEEGQAKYDGVKQTFYRHFDAILWKWDKLARLRYEDCKGEGWPDHKDVLRCFKRNKYHFPHARRTLVEEIWRGVKKGLVRVRARSFEKVSMSVEYYKPGGLLSRIFGTDYIMESNTIDDRRYRFVRTTKSDGRVHSVWLSRAADRPDIVWVPVRLDVSNNPEEDIRISAFGDIKKMFNSCVSLGEALELAQSKDEGAMRKAKFMNALHPDLLDGSWVHPSQRYNNDN